MTEAEIAKMESAFGISLPARYREWAMRLPALDCETKSWHWVFNDAERLIEENTLLRRDGWYGHAWLAHLFCIGEHDGNHYFLDLQNPDAVFYAQHDDVGYDRDNYSCCRVRSLEEFCVDE